MKIVDWSHTLEGNQKHILWATFSDMDQDVAGLWKPKISSNKQTKRNETQTWSVIIQDKAVHQISFIVKKTI
jgi:hypothetical protein